MSIEVDIVANQSSIDSALRKISANLRNLEAESARVSNNISNIAVKNVNTRNVSNELRALRSDISKTNNQLTSSVSGLSNSITSLARNIALTLGGGALTFGLVKISNDFKELENRIALVTGRTDELALTQEKLVKSSANTYNSVTTGVETFNRFGLALKDAGVSTQTLLEVTENTQKALAISGGSAESLSAAIFQLGQGLSAGALRGQELNSVLEQAPRIATAIADELGVSIGEMRKIAEEGGLTTKVVLDALLNQGEAINKEFTNIQPSIGKATTVLADAVTNYLGQIDKGLGLSNSIASRILLLSDKLNKSSLDIDLRVRENFKETGPKIKKFLGDTKLVASGIANVFSAIGSRIAGSLPRVIVPVFTLLREQAIAIGVAAIKGSAFIANEALKTRGSFYDILQTGVSIQGAFVEIFNSKDPQELNKNLNILAESILLYGNRWYNIGNIVTTVYRSTRLFFETNLKYLGLMNQRLVTIRFDTFEDFNFLLGLTNRLLKELAANIFLSPFFTQLEVMVYIASQYFDLLLSVVERTFKEITKIINPSLIKATAYITKFVNNVAKLFYDLYIYLVGNSVWTDTIEGIIYWAKYLVVTAGRVIKEFVDYVANLFKTLYEKIKITLSVMTSKIGSYLTSAFQSISKKVKSIFDKISNDFFATELNFTINFSIGQFLESALISIEALEKALLAAIVSAVLNAWIYVSKEAPILGLALGTAFVVGLAELFGVKLFDSLKLLWTTSILAKVFDEVIGSIGNQILDENLFGNLAGGLGKLIGEVFAAIINNLPFLYAALFDAAAGFREGFFAQLGFVGAAINKLIAIIPGSGLIDLLLFGSGIAILLGKFGLIKNIVSGMLTFILGRSIGGVAGNAGLLSFLLLGNGRMILAGFAAVFGLIQLIPGLFNDVGSKVANLFGAAGLFSVLFFGAGNTMRGVIHAIDFIGTYLLRMYGSSASLSLAGILWPQGTAVGLMARIRAFWAWFRFNTITQASRANLAASLLAGFTPALAFITQAYMAQMASLRARSIALGGTFGIVGNVLFGRIGRTALIAATILSIFVGVASASTDVAGEISSTSYMLEYGLIGLAIFGMAAGPKKIIRLVSQTLATIKNMYRAFFVILAIESAAATAAGSVIKAALLRIGAVIVAWLAAFVGFLFSWVTLAIAGVGLIAILLFGEGDSAFDKLANFKNAIVDFFTLTTAGGREARKSIEGILEPLQSSFISGIDLSGPSKALKEVDLSGMNYSEIDSLKSSIKPAVTRLEELQEIYKNEGKLTRTERREANSLLAEINNKIKETPLAGSERSRAELSEETLNTLQRMSYTEGMSGSESLIEKMGFLGMDLSNLLSFGMIGDSTAYRKPESSDIANRVSTGSMPLLAAIDIEQLRIDKPELARLVETLSFAMSSGLEVDKKVLRDFNEAFSDVLSLNDPKITKATVGNYLSDVGKDMLNMVGGDFKTFYQERLEDANKAREQLEQQLGLVNEIQAKETVLANIKKLTTKLGLEELSDQEKKNLSVAAAVELQKELTRLSNLKITTGSGATEPLFQERTFDTNATKAARQQAEKEFSVLRKFLLANSDNLTEEVNSILSGFEIDLRLENFETAQFPALLSGLKKIFQAEADKAVAGNTAEANQALTEAKQALRLSLMEYKTTLSSVLQEIDTDMGISDVFSSSLGTQLQIATLGKELLQINETMATEAYASLPLSIKDGIRDRKQSIVDQISDLFRAVAIETRQIDYFGEGQDLASQIQSKFSSFTGDSLSALPLTIVGVQNADNARIALEQLSQAYTDLQTDMSNGIRPNFGTSIDGIASKLSFAEIQFTSFADKLEYARSLADNPISFNELIQLPREKLNEIDLLTTKLRNLQIRMALIKLFGAITGSDIVGDLSGVAQQIDSVVSQIDTLIPAAPDSGGSGGGDSQTWWESFKEKTDALGLSLSEDLLAGLSATGLNEIAAAGERFKAAQEAINKSAAHEVELRKASLEQMRLARLEAIDALDDGTFAGVSAQFEALGAGLDTSFIGNLTPALLQYAQGVAKQIELLNRQSQSMAAGSVELRATISEMDSLKLKLEELQSSSKVMSEAFKEGLTSFLKGEETFKGFLEGLLDTFTNTIIEKFSTGFTDSLFNALGLDELFNSLFTGVFELGSNAGTSVAGQAGGLFGGLGATPATPVFVSDISKGIGAGLGVGGVKDTAAGGEGFFSGIQGFFGNLFSKITEIFSGLFSGIGKFFTTLIGFSSGGKVSGAGTGTSDSIMAMLSNGEYVVNAATTKRWLPFLETLNSNDGRLPAFANGGMVGPSNPSAFKTLQENNNNKDKQQQVFNINVSGDVSMQTRREIARMIPEITAGVNMTNRERGSR